MLIITYPGFTLRHAFPRHSSYHDIRGAPIWTSAGLLFRFLSMSSWNGLHMSWAETQSNKPSLSATIMPREEKHQL